jgi:hypothetical protein
MDQLRQMMQIVLRNFEVAHTAILGCISHDIAIPSVTAGTDRGAEFLSTTKRAGHHGQVFLLVRSGSAVPVTPASIPVTAPCRPSVRSRSSTYWKGLFDLNKGSHAISFPLLLAQRCGSGFSAQAAPQHPAIHHLPTSSPCLFSNPKAGDSTSVQLKYAMIEAPESGIPNPTITARLDQLYPASPSYTQYLNDGTETPNLLTGVAWEESSYSQFRAPTENNPDLFSLYSNFGIAAKWPYENAPNESAGAGQYIGLMMVLNTDPDAWDWTVNTQDGVNTFSGGSSTDKVQTAVRYEGYIIKGYSYTVNHQKVSLPAHINGDGSYLSSLTGYERENNALVIYAGDLVGCGSGNYSCVVASLYYVSQCPSPGVQVTDKHGNLVCQGGTWQWVTNSTGQPEGVSYVNYVRTNDQ